MQFIYGTAPIKYINDIPAHKAGEWPGIKPCKFHSYKRVIRPVDCGVIFNEKEPLPPPRRKLLGPKNPTPEYIFKPSCRMIPNPNRIIEREEGLRYIPFPSKEPIPRPEKRHEFPYRRDLDRRENEKKNRMNSLDIFRQEFKVISNIGFSKQQFKNMTNQQLLEYDFTRDRFGALKMHRIKGYNSFHNNYSSNSNNKMLSKTANIENRKNVQKRMLVIQSILNFLNLIALIF